MIWFSSGLDEAYVFFVAGANQHFETSTTNIHTDYVMIMFLCIHVCSQDPLVSFIFRKFFEYLLLTTLTKFTIPLINRFMFYVKSVSLNISDILSFSPLQCLLEFFKLSVLQRLLIRTETLITNNDILSGALLSYRQTAFKTSTV